jgi:hypothetical protein
MGIEALRALERAFVNQALFAKHLQCLIDRARTLDFRFRREEIVVDSKQAEVVADEVEHRLNRRLAEHREPLLLRHLHHVVAVIGGEHDRDGLQIIARIEAFGDLADVLAERLAVAKVQRPGERIDLRARIVDIIFLGDPEAGRLEDPRQAVADDGAAAMAHVQRARRVRRNIFDVDPLLLADRAQAIFVALA